MTSYRLLAYGELKSRIKCVKFQYHDDIAAHSSQVQR